MSEGETIIRLAALVDNQRNELLTEWRQRVLQLPDARQLDIPTINDEVPQLLKDLSRALRSGLEASSGDVDTISAEHGVLRWQAGFDVTEVVAEYNILRSCLQDLAESDGIILSGKVAHIVHRLFDEAVGRAIKAFETMMTIELQHRHGEHIGFILHDLRTPLDAITLATALLERSFHKGSEHPSVKSAFSVLHGNIVRLDGQLRHVLTQEAGLGNNFQPEFTLLNLREQIDALIHDLSPLATLVNTSVINEVPPDVVVLSETRLLAQIVQNLLSNALKFTAQGRITVGAKQAVDGTVTCWVKDTGQGIPSDRLEKVFERFETQGPPERRGIGLGLSIVKEIVELHGGHVWAESELGNGSTFTFVIPNLASD